jgi:RNA polymerase sigma factor for flagellar operon FliA
MTQGGELRRRRAEHQIHDALGIVDQVAGQLHARLGRRIALDELRSLGRAAVTELVRRHDDKQSPFAPFIAARVRWAILDGVRRDARHGSLAQRAHALAASRAVSDAQQRVRAKHLEPPPSERDYRGRLAALLCDHATAMGLALVAGPSGGLEAVADSSERPDRRTSRAADGRALRAAVAKLGNATWRDIIEGYYFEGCSLEQLAERAGHDKSWASRQHARAIRALGNVLRGGELDPSRE